MTIVLEGIAQAKIVTMSIRQKRMKKAVTKVFNANCAATICTTLKRIKNHKICCLIVMVHIALSKSEWWLPKKYLHFWRIFSANHI